MASMNKVFLLGRLGKDPELRTTQSGQSVCVFSLATDESYVSNGQKVQKAEWHSIVVWGNQAQPCSQYLHKGSSALVEGSIASRKYTDKQGVERVAFEIKALRVQFLDPRESNGQQGGYQQQPQRQTQGGYQSRQQAPVQEPLFPSEAPAMDDVPF